MIIEVLVLIIIENIQVVVKIRVGIEIPLVSDVLEKKVTSDLLSEVLVKNLTEVRKIELLTQNIIHISSSHLVEEPFVEMVMVHIVELVIFADHHFSAIYVVIMDITVNNVAQVNSVVAEDKMVSVRV